MTYHIYVGNRFIGIIESNLTFARSYWIERRRITGINFKLVRK